MINLGSIPVIYKIDIARTLFILFYYFRYKINDKIQTIEVNFTASISELKKSPAQILKQAGDNVVAILNHNVPSAYLVPSAIYEKMIEIIDDYHLSKAVDIALASDEKPIKVSLDEL